MNRIIFYILFILGIESMVAQTASTLADVNTLAYGLSYDQDNLFVSSTFSSDVFRINLSSSTTVQEFDIYNGPTQHQQRGICKYGDYILLSRYSQNKIVRFAPTSTPFVIEDVVTATQPNGLAVWNNNLYISSNNKILLVNLNMVNPTTTEIATVSPVTAFGTGTIGLKIYNDFLYVAENTGIYKINLSSGNYEKVLVTNFTGSSFVFGNDPNILYLTSGTNEIYQVNLLTQTITTLVVLNQFIFPNTLDIIFAENKLYFTCIESNNIGVIEIALDIKEFKPVVSIFPNPTNSMIYLNADNVKQAIIFNSAGQQISIVKVQNNSIDLSQFETGIYYLKIDEAIEAIKVIKN